MKASVYLDKILEGKGLSPNDSARLISNVVMEEVTKLKEKAENTNIKE